MKILECSNVSVKYNNQFAIKDINFILEKNDYLCVVGENGTGKTTLMKAILKLVKIDSGNIIFNGVNANEIGYLPQLSNLQKNFPATVLEVVKSGLVNKQKLFGNKNLDLKIVREKLNDLKISDLENKAYCNLSGGQKQRVLLARAMCASDNLLLLDEPVNGLDPIVTKELYMLVKELNEKQNKTIIMISHDVHTAVKYANKILHLRKEVMFFGNTNDYLESEIGRYMVGGKK